MHSHYVVLYCHFLLYEITVHGRHLFYNKNKSEREIRTSSFLNPLNAELNPIRHLLALVGARHIVHVSRIRVKHTKICVLITVFFCNFKRHSLVSFIISTDCVYVTMMSSNIALLLTDTV